MTIIIPLIPIIFGGMVGLAIFFGGNLFADYTTRKSVYGKLLDHDFLVHYFNINLKKYKHLINDDILTAREDFFNLPYIVSHGKKSHFSKYYIHGVGQIPLKSPFTSILDRKFKKLQAEYDEPI